MPSNDRPCDILVYGATGYTGRLVAEYLVERSRDFDGLKWGLAGRSRDKLAAVRDAIGASDIPIVVADASDPASLQAMAGSTRVVLTTVGPYSLYGSPLVEACAKAGTDYVDLTGEPNWMRQMIDTFEPEAKRTGAHIVFSSGLDSLPSEIGVWYLQQLAIEKFGKPMPRVRGRIVKFVGGPSGGSVATATEMMRASQSDPSYVTLMADPFSLTPGFEGPPQPTGLQPIIEDDLGPVQPFMLGPVDMKNVRRSNFLMGFPYGRDFVYDEMMLGEPPAAPRQMPDLKPGEGPSAEALEKGSFDMLYIGSDDEGHRITARLHISKNPGYLMTARMIVETALCLCEGTGEPGGMWTPGALFQGKLVDRLTQNACMTFSPGDD